MNADDQNMTSHANSRADVQARIQAAADLVRDGSGTGDLNTITAGLEAFTRLLVALPMRDPDRPRCLVGLGWSYFERFDLTGAPADLDAAIEQYEQALALAPDDDPMRIIPMIDLTRTHWARFANTKDMADLRATITHGESAVAHIPTDQRFAHLMSIVAKAYRKLYERSFELAHAHAAVDRAEQAAAAVAADDPHRSEYMAVLSHAYLVRYDRTAVLGDLRGAIDSAEDALAGAPDRAQRAQYLCDLAGAYLRLFNREKALGDLATAIEYGEQALEIDESDDVTLSLLGAAYEARFGYTDMPDDLRAAIEYCERAIIAAADDPGRHTNCVHSLGIRYQTRYLRFGDAADLDTSIAQCTSAVASTAHDDPELPMRLSSLANSYLLRFQRAGDSADARTAIEYGAQAVDATPQDHPDLASRLFNLGVAYRIRYDQGRGYDGSRQRDDLRTSVELGEQAVAATRDQDPALAGRLCVLGSGYRDLFESTLDPQRINIDRAVEYGRRALAITSEGAPQRNLYLSNLGASYCARFDEYGEPSDLEAAIDCCERAVASTPADHPARVGYLNNLAYVYDLRYSPSPERPDPDVVARLVEYAADLSAAPPWEQVSTAHAVATVLMHAGETHAAAQLFRTAVLALRSVMPRDLSRVDQERRGSRHAGLISEAIAAQLEAGDAGGALEVAELGRGILLSADLDTRADLTELTTAAPELAAAFHELRAQLNAPDVTRRRAAAARWDHLLDRIRQQDGFSDFLAPPRLPDLQQAAADGAVVIVNIARRRSDAILVRANGVNSIKLRLNSRDLDNYTRKLVRADPDTFAGSLARRGVVADILAWLWETVAAPVLDALGHTATLTDSWPRLWWVPTGALSRLPLHAAGLPGGPTVADRVISSYAPTIRALLHSRQRPTPPSRHQLTVAVGDTLPHSAAEALDARICPPGTSLLSGDAATAANVLAALPDATWAHFACHATANPREPSAGGLVLHDAILPVSRIRGLHLASAELAYLSACSTAWGAPYHPDEAIHLASAFHLAGYRHVICTLWPVVDSTAATAAQRFYRLLPDSPSADTAPVALHRLTRELRAERPDRPDLWAPFIHSGP